MTRALLHRVGRALALTTVFTTLVWLPAAPAGADLADGDTTTTLPSDPTTTTTTTTTAPDPDTSTTSTSTAAPNPAFPPAGATVITDAAGDPPSAGDDPGTGGGAATPSAGSGRTPRPSASGPDSKRSETGDEEVPDPNWFDASGLSGLLGVGSGLPPAAADVATPGGDLQLALRLVTATPGRRSCSP